MNEGPGHFAWLVVADDLTGACDAGVQFARRGLATSVMLAMDAAPPDTQAVAVSTDSRNLAEAEATDLVAKVAEQLTAGMVFKKIDSVLRGNPGAEIATALTAFGREAVVATPAFPAMGRVVDGRNRTEVARTLRSDVHVAADRVAAALASGARIVSADAGCEADLDAIVAGGIASGRRVVWAGSGGLAGALAKRWAVRQADEGGGLSDHLHRHKEVTFCIGSEHEVTLRQVAELVRARPASLILRLDAIQECGVLALSGGDTAAAVCRAVGARRIDLRDEILPGIPWGILRCGRFDGVPVVTKSGGFGAADAWIRVAEYFA
jgi:uncharacterized protein YgbK (DUF1537 family)